MNSVWNNIIARWASYRFRFVPWMLLNLKDKHHRSVTKVDDKLVSDDVVIDSLIKLFTCWAGKPSLIGASINTTQQLESSRNQDMMKEVLGFKLELRASNIRNGGTGVFLSEGNVMAGSLVALYPGTVYRVMEPLFLVSLGNSYVFRCIDGLHVDGRDRGISKIIFKSCVSRDVRWPYPPADVTWLTGTYLNPLNCGQYVNNETTDYPCNVVYQECDLPLDAFPIELRRYLPNVYYSSASNRETQQDCLRIVALIAAKDIGANTELLANYYTVVRVTKK